MAAKFHDPPCTHRPAVSRNLLWWSALAWITAVLLGFWVVGAFGCAYTAVEMKPDGSLSYYSSKNTRAVAKDSDGDGVVDEYELVGDASTVINAQAEAFKAGVEAGRAVAP